MKNYMYITIVCLTCLAVFIISCQKENSSPEELTPNTTHLSEVRWVEHCDCGDDFGGCKYLCVGEGGCCCQITWKYLGQEPFPSLGPHYCKAWDDISQHCSIACTAEPPEYPENWPGQFGSFCPSRFDVQPNPPLRPTYICVPYGTYMSFWNPSTSHEMEFSFNCNGQVATYMLKPRESITLDFDGCAHSIHCQG